MDLNDIDAYDYDLPEELIAQRPAERRDGSRLMRLAAGAAPECREFSELPAILRPGDLLVMNDTRVLAARALGTKLSPGGGADGGARAEIFFLRPSAEADLWETLVRPGRRLSPGARVLLDGGDAVTIEARTEGGGRLVRLPRGVMPEEFFSRCGRVPLPPYIREELADEERYQTVYSDRAKTRSSAAPTAGLHFTPELLARLEAGGVRRAFVTLDVGPGTFRPVKARDIREHVMHSERCSIEPAQAEAINAARREGRRIVAVGTTSVRTLETFAGADGVVASGERDTDIFIRPGYEFRAADVLITNFHLPKSTLLMLVAAFAGYARIMAAYREAVERRFRFFSFGDAMLIER